MSDKKIVTNGDRIRAMTDEELAGMIMGAPLICAKIKLCGDKSGCEECCFAWLRSPVEGSNECNDRNLGET